VVSKGAWVGLGGRRHWVGGDEQVHVEVALLSPLRALICRPSTPSLKPGIEALSWEY